MREHLGFLKTSSAVVKVAAWIFLLFGGYGVILMVFGRIPAEKTMIGGAVAFILLFFLLYIIAKISDLLVKIINEIKKE